MEVEKSTISWSFRQRARGFKESPPSTGINCHDKIDFEHASRCIYRDDITTKLNVAYSLLFVIFGLALFLACRNLFKLSKASKTHPRMLIYRVVNTLIVVSLLARLAFYLDSLFTLASDHILPLKLYMMLNALATLSNNSSMVIGAYSWILGLLTMNFNNRFKPIARLINYLLVTYNCITFLVLTGLFFEFDIRDEDYEREYRTNLPSLLLAIPTALDGFYFALSCIMMWKYLQNTHTGSKAIIIDRLAIIVGVVSFLRVGQNTLEATVETASELRENSILNDDWIWPVFCLVYMVITEFFPMILLILKFSLNSKSTHASQADVIEGVSTRVLNEDDLEREILEYERGRSYVKSIHSECSTRIEGVGTTVEEK